jgi:hypothetical protein
MKTRSVVMVLILGVSFLIWPGVRALADDVKPAKPARGPHKGTQQVQPVHPVTTPLNIDECIRLGGKNVEDMSCPLVEYHSGAKTRARCVITDKHGHTTGSSCIDEPND